MYAPDQDTFTALSGGQIPAAVAPGVVLMGANPERKSFVIHNNSPSILFVRFGNSITTANYSFQIAALGNFVAPSVCPTGSIWGLWGTASGSAQVTDIS